MTVAVPRADVESDDVDSDDVEQVVTQRLVLVLPSTGAFDSRTWRIAETAAARGHHVTVVARRGDGLPTTETTPSGIRVVRVGWDAVDGLPPGVRQLARLVRGRRPVAAAATAPAAGGAGRPGMGRVVGRLGRSAWRLVAIALTVRSQGNGTLRVAPAADLVHAMAYMGVPIGLRLGRRDRAAVVYDARDIYVEARTIAQLPGPLRRLFAWIEGRWARAASRVVTVNEPYAEVLARRFGEPPLVVMNCSDRLEPTGERPRRFHEALGLAAGRRVVLYHGGFSRDRGIEELLDAIDRVDDATLVLLGYGELEAWIRAEIARRGGDRVAVLPAVPPVELLSWVGSADVVAMPIQGSTLNHRLTTPNKLFEAIAAGVPVVASDLPGMATIVRATGCGRLVDPADPASIAAGIRAILDAGDAERIALADGIADAQARYTWEHQAEVLLTEYGRLTGQPW